MRESPTFPLTSGLSLSSGNKLESRSVVSQSLWLSSRAVMNSVSIGIIDGCALLLALGAGASMRYLLVGSPLGLPAFGLLLIPAWWIGALLAGLLPGWGLSAVDHLRRQVVLITTLFCFGAVLMFFTRTATDISRIGIASAWFFAVVLVPCGRTLIRHILCRHQVYGMPTVIFGTADAAAEIASRLRSDPGLGYVPVGICTDDKTDKVGTLPVLGDFSNIAPLAPAAVIVSTGMTAPTNHAVIERVLAVYRRVTILPDLGDVPSSFVLPRDLTGTVGLEISQTLLSPFAPKLKRALDLVLVISTAPIWLPVVVVICVALWLADGENPVFRQERIGRGGRIFYALKCRTMVPNAETVLKQHLEANPVLRREWERDFKLRHDPRITRLGHFLRRTSLDELPQLFNVLRGDMALVGPRPLPAYHLERLNDQLRKLRARMRPGLTGLWQVSGRSDAGTDGMTRWDHYYVRNWSLWLDFVIFVRTLRAVVRGSGAR